MSYVKELNEVAKKVVSGFTNDPYLDRSCLTPPQELVRRMGFRNRALKLMNAIDSVPRKDVCRSWETFETYKEKCCKADEYARTRKSRNAKLAVQAFWEQYI